MLVHRCDRCGEIYDSYGYNRYNPKETNAFKLCFVNDFPEEDEEKCEDQELYELCPDCIELLKDWVEKAANGKK